MSNPKQKKGTDLSGLDAFNVSDLVSGPSSRKDDKEESNVTGKILTVAIELLHEDPDNTRTVFDEKKIAELAESFKSVNPNTNKQRGIKTPLSVRPHASLVGEYVINAGHRRFRAAKKAEFKEVPIFVDSDADDYDNTVDNLQREGLTAMELAMFIARRVEEGDSKGEVAKRLGRPASVISDHSIFFELPLYIREMYDDAICQSMQGLAILHRADKKYPTEVEAFCVAQQDEVTVSQIRAFVESLKEAERYEQEKEAQIEISQTDATEQGSSAQEQPADDTMNTSQVEAAEQPSATQEQSADGEKHVEQGNSPEEKPISNEANAGQAEALGERGVLGKLHQMKQMITLIRQGDPDALDLLDVLVNEVIEAS